MQARVGRNDRCSCCSGKKFKNCCLNAAPTKAASAAPVPDPFRLAAQTRVTLHAFKTKPEIFLNGKSGTVLRQQSSERWQVRLDDGTEVAVHLANLAPATEFIERLTSTALCDSELVEAFETGHRVMRKDEHDIPQNAERARCHFKRALEISLRTEPEESLICVSILRNLASVQDIRGDARLELNIRCLELLERRHAQCHAPLKPTEPAGMFVLTETEWAFSMLHSKPNVGFHSFINALRGVLVSLDEFGGSRSLQSLPEIARRAIESAPQIIADAHTCGYNARKYSQQPMAVPADLLAAHPSKLVQTCKQHICNTESSRRGVAAAAYFCLALALRESDGRGPGLFYKPPDYMEICRVDPAVFADARGKSIRTHTLQLRAVMAVRESIESGTPLLGLPMDTMDSWPLQFRNMLALLSGPLGALPSMHDAFYTGDTVAGAAVEKALASSQRRQAKHALQKCALDGCTAVEQNIHDFQSCSRCKMVKYCCQEHQRQHWKVHKKSCCAPCETK